MTILAPSRLADTSVHDRLDLGQNFGAMTHTRMQTDTSATVRRPSSPS